MTTDSDSSSAMAAGRPVVFGEVLFDRFPDGSSVLGGAPFNVVWHLQGFGLHPLLISRIGTDKLGEQVIAAMENWGLDTRGVQLDAHHPTGVVNVALKDGQPTFDIVPDRAYDFIDSDAARSVIASGPVSLLYHGTLSARNEVSRETLEALRLQLRAPWFVDINLRRPWWTADQAARALRDAKWVKLNDAELQEIADHQGLVTADLNRAAAGLRRHFGIDVLIVTRGEHGAFIDGPDGTHNGEPVRVPRLVDTVGAGDAFSAVTILGLTRGWSSPVILRRALVFAAVICGIRGATTDDKSLYRSLLEQWEREGV